MNHNNDHIDNNISQTLAQLRITEVPVSFDAKLHQALQAERQRMTGRNSVTIMPWQRIMAMAASFLLAVSVGILSAEYAINSQRGSIGESTQDVVRPVTEDLSTHSKIETNIIQTSAVTVQNYRSSCTAPDYTEVMSAAQMHDMRADMEQEGYDTSVDCDSLEECVNYMHKNNLDSSQCMVVGYIGETSYVILSNMESIVVGGASGLEGLVGQYEVFSK